MSEPVEMLIAELREDLAARMDRIGATLRHCELEPLHTEAFLGGRPRLVAAQARRGERCAQVPIDPELLQEMGSRQMAEFVASRLERGLSEEGEVTI